MRGVGTFSLITHSERTETDLVYEAASYLSTQKGYEAIPIVDHAGIWRPELLVKNELGSIEDLKVAWEKARTDDDIADSVRKIGRALNVDGIVSIWLEEYGGGSGIEGGLWRIFSCLSTVVLRFAAHQCRSSDL